MYDLKIRLERTQEKPHGSPLTSRRIRRGKDVTVVATSIMVLETLRAADHLAQSASIDCAIIELDCVSHPDKTVIVESVRKTGRLFVADTSWQAYGVCAEVCRIVCEQTPTSLKAAVVTIGMQPARCPTAKSLEDLYYPDLRDLTDAVAKLVTGQTDHRIPLPDENSMADVYKRFKGPF